VVPTTPTSKSATLTFAKPFAKPEEIKVYNALLEAADEKDYSLSKFIVRVLTGKEEFNGGTLANQKRNKVTQSHILKRENKMAETKELLYDPTLMELLDNPTPDIEGDFDPDAEYNRPAPPIHDGWYYGTFSNAGVYSKGATQPTPFRISRWKNEQKDHFEVAVKAEIQKPEDPLVNGKHVYTDMALRTKPDPDRNNASGISAAYRALAGEPIKGMSEAQHAKQFVELLQTQPRVGSACRMC
jgi:hypothetical protein